MANNHKSSSHVQRQAEAVLYQKVTERLQINLESNPKIYIGNNGSTYIQPDFYSAEHCVVGEIFAHIGKPKKAQDNKIANDILKMLLLQKATGKRYRKILVVCDLAEKEHLEGKSVLAESIRRFGVEVLYIALDDKIQKQILQAQELQKMTNAE